MPSTPTARQRFFRSPYVISVTMLLLLLQCSPYVSSSPTPRTSVLSMNSDLNNPDEKINYESDGFRPQINDYQRLPTGDSRILSRPNAKSQSESASNWYVQPRAHANQFLTSHLDENDLLVPKWFTKLNRYDQGADLDLDLDDSDDYVPSLVGFHKRSPLPNQYGISHLKKRKQMNKPPMEVMNEIVNSIYLKR